MEEQKQCEQCQKRKDLSAFHRRKNKTDGRMRICAECYMANLHDTQRRQREFQQERERQRAEEQRRRAEESERAQALLPTLLQGTKVCQMCQQEFPVNASGFLVVPFFAMHSTTCERCGKSFTIEYTMDGRVNYGCPGHGGGLGPAWYGYSEKYCPPCHEERHKNNRQAYPFCPMCGTPTSVSEFLREYRGYRLDLIKVCCKQCIPAFEALTDREQIEWLRRAMVKAYGETAVIYALQYDDTFPYQHIGRTKHLKRRMADYRRNWYREVKAHHVLEVIPFGPLSMERESRWILHALKQGWPIDNFDMLAPDKAAQQSERADSGADRIVLERLYENHAKELCKKEELTVSVADFEPLTAPFETIEPLLKHFGNTIDAHIVHWFMEQQGDGIAQ
jgi:hypothetical protein